MFRQVTEKFFAAPQIGVDEVREASARGITAIINNRPEGEADDQTPGDDIRAAADAAGLKYTEIPVTHAGFSEAQVEAMRDALEAAEGPALAYCRSGTRSTFLWALAQASKGGNPDEIAAAAASAGYDISPIRQLVEMLAAKGSNTAA